MKELANYNSNPLDKKTFLNNIYFYKRIQEKLIDKDKIESTETKTSNIFSFCPQCGYNNKNQYDYCPKCGQDLKPYCPSCGRGNIPEN